MFVTYSDDAGDVTRIDVQSDGDVVIQEHGNATFMSIDNIHFLAEQ
jgi:hypothetical protein